MEACALDKLFQVPVVDRAPGAGACSREQQFKLVPDMIKTTTVVESTTALAPKLPATGNTPATRPRLTLRAVLGMLAFCAFATSQWAIAQSPPSWWKPPSLTGGWVVSGNTGCPTT